MKISVAVNIGTFTSKFVQRCDNIALPKQNKPNIGGSTYQYLLVGNINICPVLDKYWLKFQHCHLYAKAFSIL